MAGLYNFGILEYEHRLLVEARINYFGLAMDGSNRSYSPEERGGTAKPRKPNWGGCSMVIVVLVREDLHTIDAFMA
jgi:hypothetical protein